MCNLLKFAYTSATEASTVTINNFYTQDLPQWKWENNSKFYFFNKHFLYDETEDSFSNKGTNSVSSLVI